MGKLLFAPTGIDMDKIPHHRRSTRLKSYDYSRPGAYFVTVCVNDRQNLFGGIEGGKMILNDTGKIVNDTWQWLKNQYEYVELDEFIIMPNHIHGIIHINDIGRGGSRTAPTMKRKPLGRLIGVFKTVSTKEINVMRKTHGNQFWQRNYYEHIIRNDAELNRTRQYIMENPLKWDMDSENPDNTRKFAYGKCLFSNEAYGKFSCP